MIWRPDLKGAQQRPKRLHATTQFQEFVIALPVFANGYVYSRMHYFRRSRSLTIAGCVFLGTLRVSAFTPNGLYEVVPPDGADYRAHLMAMSAAGNVVVGYVKDRDSFYMGGAFRWTAAEGFTEFGRPSTAARALNNDGSVVVGDMPGPFGGGRAYRWTEQQGMVDIQTLPSAITSTALATSDDGGVVAGSMGVARKANYGSNDRVFRWTASSGAMIDIGTLGGADASFTAMTPDGRVIIGTSTTRGGDRYSEKAFHWSADTGIMTNLGTLGGHRVVPLAVSTNGNVVAGSSATETSGMHVFRWTARNGVMTDLGTLGGAASYMADMTPDGRVIVGSSYLDRASARPGSASHAFRWSADTGVMVDLGTLGRESDARAVSDDGHVVVGYSGTRNHHARVFRWTTATQTMADLGTLGGDSSYFTAMTPDGRVIVGSSDTAPAGGDDARAFRWTEITGMQSVEQWLAESGVSVNPDLRTGTASLVSADGSVVVGRLENGILYIAKGGSGLMSVQDLNASVVGVAASLNLQQEAGNLVFNGAHGHPLSRRTEAGRFTAWAAGDYGADDHGNRDGYLGVAEAGGGYNFGALQLNVALGKTTGRQRTPLGGRGELDGTYVIADVLVPIPQTPLIVTVSGFYQWSSLNVRRGYLNAGSPDYSEGSTDAGSAGGSLRVDWENAVTVEKIDFTPYLKFTAVNTRSDAFTETGGGFPAAFDSRSENVSDLTLGINSERPLTKNLRLVTTLEGVHRFQNSGSSINGTVSGVSSFSVPGETYRQDWLRASVGVDYAMGKGVMSMSLNGTTRSSSSNLWLATSYQLHF